MTERCKDLLIRFETEHMIAGEVIELFSELIKTGDAWSLQGSYGRIANGFIEAKYISKDGTILWKEEADA